MAKEDEESFERLQNGMSISNLADRLKAQIMVGPSNPLNQESNNSPQGKPDEPQKE